MPTTQILHLPKFSNILQPLSVPTSLPSPLQPAESRNEGSVALGIGFKEDMIVKIIKIATTVEGSSTLERWKPILVFPEFLPACSVSSLEEHCGVPGKGSL